MMAFGSASAAIQDLKSRLNGIAVALVARDGTVLFADLPAGVYAETFAIMSATILGAAATECSELGRSPPTRIVLNGAGATTILAPAGGRALLVAVVPNDVDPGAAIEQVERFADLLAPP